MNTKSAAVTKINEIIEVSDFSTDTMNSKEFMEYIEHYVDEVISAKTVQTTLKRLKIESYLHVLHEKSERYDLLSKMLITGEVEIKRMVIKPEDYDVDDVEEFHDMKEQNAVIALFFYNVFPSTKTWQEFYGSNLTSVLYKLQQLLKD